MKRKYAVCALLLVYCLTGLSQAPSWLWAKSARGTAGGSKGMGSVTDKNGNIYVTGIEASDSLIFDNIELQGNASNHFFLAKYAPSGQAIWVKTATLTVFSQGFSVAVDNEGNVYASGIYNRTTPIAFDNVTIDTGISAYRNSAFLVKYDSSGNALWANAVPVSSSPVAHYYVTTDKEDNIYFTGNFQADSCVFGNYKVYNPNTVPRNNYFLVKYSPNGLVQWATAALPSSGSSAVPYGICTDKNDGIYITGDYTGATLGIGDFTLYAGMSYDNVFTVKYDTAGNTTWANTSACFCFASGLSADENQNVYTTGFFGRDSAIFGDQTLYAGSFLQIDSDKMYIIKYDVSGNTVWAKSSGGRTGGRGFGIANDGNGNVYVTASFSSRSFTFDTTTLSRPANSKAPMAVLTLNPDGGILCSTVLHDGAYTLTGYPVGAICTDPSDNTFVTGGFSDSTFILGNHSLQATSSAGLSMYLGAFHCGDISNIESIDPSATGKLELYPNPISTQAIINYTVPADSKNVAIAVYDITGRLCNSYALNSNSGQLNIYTNNQSDGLYLCALLLNGKVVATQKMAVQH